jgi:hypothetical protein
MNNLQLFPSLSITNLVSSFGIHAGQTTGSMSLFFAPFAIILFAAIVLIFIPLCLIFRKAGRAWWEALIPFYNIYVLTIITGQSWWIIFGFFLPIIGWVTTIYLYYHLSKRFGFDIPFTLGLVLLPFIFLPILGFGSALYSQPEVEESPAMVV